MKTADLIRQTVESHIESSEPAASVRKFLSEYEDKRINNSVIDKLNEQIPGYEFRLLRQFGMSSIEWSGYNREGGRPSGSLLIGHTVTNLRFNMERFSQSNIAYYEAAEARNAERRAVLANPMAIAKLAQAVDVFVEARNTIKELLDNEFDADRYTLEQMLNLKED